MHIGFFAIVIKGKEIQFSSIGHPAGFKNAFASLHPMPDIIPVLPGVKGVLFTIHDRNLFVFSGIIYG